MNAERYVRTEGRRTQRTGYHTRKSSAGKLELEVPPTRDGESHPLLLQRYQRSEKMLAAALAQCYVQGISIRRVSQICDESFDGGVRYGDGEPVCPAAG